LDLSENNFTNPFKISEFFGNWQNLKTIKIENVPCFNDKKDLSSFVAILKRDGKFSSLEEINSQPIPKKVGFDIIDAAVASAKNIPSNIEHGIAENKKETIAGTIWNFIQTFVEVFDSDQREDEIEKYYNKNACFSITALNGWAKDSDQDISYLYPKTRNLNIPGKGGCKIETCHGKFEILAFIKKLPKFKHVIDSLGEFDIGFVSESALHLTFGGKIYEKADGDKFFIRNFHRTLILGAIGGECSNDLGFLILNDMLVLKAMSPREIQASNSKPVLEKSSTESASSNFTSTNDMSVLVESGQKNKIFERLLAETKLKNNYATQLLEQHDYDYAASISHFNEMKAQGKISEDLLNLF